MKPYVEVAIAFARALIDGEFERAHGLLSPDLRMTTSPDSLRDDLFSMLRVQDVEGDPPTIWFDEDLHEDPVHESWPAKQAGDVGWVYVGIERTGINEAVTVTVSKIDGGLKIRDIEWGRP